MNRGIILDRFELITSRFYYGRTPKLNISLFPDLAAPWEALFMDLNTELLLTYQKILFLKYYCTNLKVWEIIV